jgi:hypothetical protein
VSLSTCSGSGQWSGRVPGYKPAPAQQQIARLELDLALQGHPTPEPEARRLFAAMARGVAL